MNLEEIKKAIMEDPENEEFTKRGIKPLYTAFSESKVALIGQAPGRVAEENGVVWLDKSGDRLREWLGVTKEEFYDSKVFSILPMDFYFLGKGESGDLPPRKDFASKWHPLILENMKELELIVLIGSYATKYYLKEKSGFKLTDVVMHYEDYLPKYFPIIHPSPRNQIWIVEHTWFIKEVVPALQEKIKKITGF